MSVINWPTSFEAAEFDEETIIKETIIIRKSGKEDGSGEERTSRRRKQLPECTGRTFE
jgi:hypothetical protein